MDNHGGYREGAGRPKGSKNLRTVEIEAKIQELGCPFEGMARVAKKAEASGDLATAGRLYAELGRYLAPQRKAVDPDERHNNAGVGFTLEELAQLRDTILAGKMDDVSLN